MTTLTYRQMQIVLKNARNEGQIESTFKLNQKKAILQAKIEELIAKAAAENEVNQKKAAAAPTTEDAPAQTTDILTATRQAIETLAAEYDNYIPMFALRPLMGGTRKEQDATFYHLESIDEVELSSLVDTTPYTDDQLMSGIEQDIGGPLFFLDVA
jgi:pyruvate/2-oxoglutarate dehydrogenase complex dihydrolipoamide acyltransferase (E2) component